MSVTLSVRPGPRGAAYWGITWGVTVGIVEYLTVAPIDDWGSVKQVIFWLLYWIMPYWCVVGCMLVWLADHHARFGSRGRLIAAFLALGGLSAALDPMLAILLIRLARGAFPEFERYAAELRPIEPTWANWSSLFLYQAWEVTFYGGLLVAARIFTMRVERTRHLLHQSAMARSRTEGLLDAARLQALQSQIDPKLLLDSMHDLEQRYRVSPERAERLLEALVEFLRYAMHGLRVPVSTLDAELQLARAFSQLQRERNVQSAWRIVEESAVPGNAFKFPSLLMLPLMALGGDGARPMLRFRAKSGEAILSLHGLSRGVPAELSQQVRGRLHSLYGERFQFDSSLSATNQLRITLRPTNTRPGEAYE
jgi:signal transduction histidine kinase